MATVDDTRVQPPPRYPLRDFFRNPERSFYRLSDDGRTLGFMQPAGEAHRMNLFVQALDGGVPSGAPRQLTHETARDIASYFFKGNEVLLYLKDFAGDENFHLLAVQAGTGWYRRTTWSWCSVSPAFSPALTALVWPSSSTAQ